jgi:hypothetical protein
LLPQVRGYQEQRKDHSYQYAQHTGPVDVGCGFHVESPLNQKPGTNQYQGYQQHNQEQDNGR